MAGSAGVDEASYAWYDASDLMFRTPLSDSEAPLSPRRQQLRRSPPPRPNKSPQQRGNGGKKHEVVGRRVGALAERTDTLEAGLARLRAEVRSGSGGRGRLDVPGSTPIQAAQQHPNSSSSVPMAAALLGGELDAQLHEAVQAAVGVAVEAAVGTAAKQLKRDLSATVDTQMGKLIAAVEQQQEQLQQKQKHPPPQAMATAAALAAVRLEMDTMERTITTKLKARARSTESLALQVETLDARVLALARSNAPPASRTKEQPKNSAGSGGGRSTPRATNAALLAMERQQQTHRQNMSELLARVQQMEGSMVDVCDSHAADTVRQRSIRRHQPASHTPP